MKDINPAQINLLLYTGKEAPVYLASFGKRAGAGSLDLLFSLPLIFFFLIIYYRFTFHKLSLDTSLAWYDYLSTVFATSPVKFFAGLLFSALAPAFFRYLSVIAFGKTPGMFVFKLRYVNSKLASPSNYSIFLREFFSLFSVFILAGGYIWALFDDSFRTWHAKISKTFLVSDT
ncbi:MAG: RDD family protein [Myxococcota bacterium]